jgi:hypothetical protein
MTFVMDSVDDRGIFLSESGVSHGSSVGRVRGYGLECHVSIPGRIEIFLFPLLPDQL